MARFSSEGVKPLFGDDLASWRLLRGFLGHPDGGLGVSLWDS